MKACQRKSKLKKNKDMDKVLDLQLQQRLIECDRGIQNAKLDYQTPRN